MRRKLTVKDLPWPGVELSQNGRSHWAKKAQLVKSARQQACFKARAALGRRLTRPVGEKRLTVQLVVTPPDRRRRDETNITERCKAYYDGVADAIGVDDCFIHHREQLWQPAKRPGSITIEVEWEEEE